MYYWGSAVHTKDRAERRKHTHSTVWCRGIYRGHLFQVPAQSKDSYQLEHLAQGCIPPSFGTEILKPLRALCSSAWPLYWWKSCFLVSCHDFLRDSLWAFSYHCCSSLRRVLLWGSIQIPGVPGNIHVRESQLNSPPLPALCCGWGNAVSWRGFVSAWKEHCRNEGRCKIQKLYIVS